MCIGIEANKKKIADLLVYLSSQVEQINLKKLLKLIYLIDESSVKERMIPITWLEYKAWHYGPVSPIIYAIKNRGGVFSNDISVDKNSLDKYIISPKRTTDLKLFSKNELGIIDKVISRYGYMSAEELSDLTHEAGGIWDLTVKQHKISFADNNDQTDIAIELEYLLDKSSREMYYEVRECVEFQAALNRIAK